MFLVLDGRGELRSQVLRSLKRAVFDGRLPAGSKLPSTRQLAHELGVSRNTVIAAYADLCAEQLADSRMGSGTYVTGAVPPRERRRFSGSVEPQSRYAARLRTLAPISLARRDEALRLDLQYGEPMVDIGFFSHWRRALSYAALHTQPRAVAAQGLPALRREVALHLRRRRGLDCDADDVIITHGTQQAISLVARVLLDEHDVVALEDPHYQLADRALRAQGAQLQHVPVDADGLDPRALPLPGLKLLYVTPSHQFPSGRVMSAPRRLELIALAKRHGFWIFEDDYDGEFSFESRHLPALCSLDGNGRVIYAGSFTKTLLPSIRLGYVVAPATLRQDLVRAKMLADMSCSAIEQTAVSRLLCSGVYDRHLRKTSLELRRRRRALIDGLHTHCGDLLHIEDSGGGMHVIGWLPGFNDRQVDRLIATATTRGLGLHPVKPHFARPVRTPGLLLGFAALSVTQLKSATALLGACLQHVAELTSPASMVNCG
jgi:GntR family transcriptional regulator / MocR family aminotransferase